MGAPSLLPLAAMRQGGKVRRYHTVFTHATDTVASHTYGVLTMLYLLTNGAPSPALVKAALVHDVPECLTGDLPSPTKKALQLETPVTLAAMEDEVWQALGPLQPPSLSAAEARLLKLADVFDGLAFCEEELQRGNAEVEFIRDRYAEHALELITTGEEHGLYNQIRRR